MENVKAEPDQSDLNGAGSAETKFLDFDVPVEAITSNTTHSPSWPWLTNTKDLFAIAQSICTVGALIAAGWWFFVGRQDKPRIKIEEFVSHRVDPDDARYNDVVVDVRVTNTSNVLVDLNEGAIDIDAMRTPSKTLLTQSLVGFQLEPGETEQVFFQVFRLDSENKTIQVYAQFQPPNKDFLWHLAGAFDVVTPETESQKESSQ